MKKFLLLVSFCLSVVTMLANPISERQALMLAQKMGKQTNAPVKRAYIKQSKNKLATQSNLYYVFNRGNNEGYVVVAGDDRVAPILAWSDKGNLTEEDIKNHPSIKWLYSQYENQIEWAIKNLPDTPSDEFKRLLDANLNNIKIKVEPLLQFKQDRKTLRRNPISLGQDWPFNRYCPDFYDNQTSKTYPTVSGCVATAISTVMRWHTWPAKAKGKYSYYWQGKTLSVDFDGYQDGTTPLPENKAYDWSKMPESVTAYGNNRATGKRLDDVQSDNYGRLLRDVGYCIRMNYGPAFAGGSGAYLHDVPRAMTTHFGYKKTVKRLMRYSYGDKDWYNNILDEMQNYGPVIYAGYSDAGGHCFVLDGYGLAPQTNSYSQQDSLVYVHVDWGWTTTSNGWHLVDILDPGIQGIGGGDGAFDKAQEMIRFLQPDGETTVENDENVDEDDIVASIENVVINLTSEYENQSVTRSTNQPFKVSIKNKNDKAYKGTFALGIYADGKIIKELTRTDVNLPASQVSTLNLNGDFSDVTAGTYKIYVQFIESEVSGYLKNESNTNGAGSIIVKTNGNEPDPNPDPNPNPVGGYNLSIDGKLPETKVKSGADATFEVRIKNIGSGEFVGNVVLLATNRENYQTYTISFVKATVKANGVTPVSLSGNEDFKTLPVGQYGLVVKAGEEGKDTKFLSYNNNLYIGELFIEKNTEPQPDPGVDPQPNPVGNDQAVEISTFELFQDNVSKGSRDYTTLIRKANSTIAIRINLGSTTGYQGKVYAYLAASRNAMPDNARYGKYIDVNMAANETKEIEFDMNAAELTGGLNFLKIGYLSKTDETTYTANPKKAVAFNVVDMMTTDLENVNSTSHFNVVANDIVTINAPKAGVVRIYSMSGTLVMSVNVQRGTNLINQTLASGIYVACMDNHIQKFIKR